MGNESASRDGWSPILSLPGINPGKFPSNQSIFPSALIYGAHSRRDMKLKQGPAD